MKPLGGKEVLVIKSPNFCPYCEKFDKEVASHVGFMNEKEFYKVIGDFKLGKNFESYKVAFNQGTDNLFKKYHRIIRKG